VIDLILKSFVVLIVVSTAVIFPVFQELRGKELAASKGPPVWYKGKPLVMVIIGLVCAALYCLMVFEVNERVNETSVVVIAAVLLALPTAVAYVTLLAIYHIILWLRRR
jgi:hypothetical protein